MQWNWTILEEFVAPELRALNKFAVPELQQMPNYFNSLLVNQVFVAKLPEQDRRLTANFIARIEHANDAYRAGSAYLSQYIDCLPENDTTKLYRRSLRNFENCILHTHVAISCAIKIANIYRVEPLYQPGDCSDYDRIRRINNRIKHFDEDIICCGADNNSPTVPMWLTNEGLKSSDGEISYIELHNVLSFAEADCMESSENFFNYVRERNKKS